MDTVSAAATAVVEAVDPMAGMNQAVVLVRMTAMTPTACTDIATVLVTGTLTATAPLLQYPNTCARSSLRC